MSKEYDEGPWVDVPEGAIMEWVNKDGSEGDWPILRYRILTPKPRREFVVGKWYRTYAGWRACIAITKEGAWLAHTDGCPVAHVWSIDRIDWSVPPRDEAPE